MILHRMNKINTISWGVDAGLWMLDAGCWMLGAGELEKGAVWVCFKPQKFGIALDS